MDNTETVDNERGQGLVTLDWEMGAHPAEGLGKKVAMYKHGGQGAQKNFRQGGVVAAFGVQLEGLCLNSSTVSYLWHRRNCVR